MGVYKIKLNNVETMKPKLKIHLYIHHLFEKVEKYKRQHHGDVNIYNKIELIKRNRCIFTKYYHPIDKLIKTNLFNK